MKKYFGLLLTLIGLLGTSVFATYEDFSRQLETMGMDVQKIESQNTISRYDLARLLNIVECKDCINPAQDMINKYVQNFWSAFSSGKDFNDINYLGGIYNNTSYYYCVAYVADNTYMRGYPLATSPICGGKFCGNQNTTTAEFLQVVINILAKYVFKDLTFNWKEANTRINKLKTDSYEAKNFTIEDKKMFAEKNKSCENTCALQNKDEVNLYLKYCMFNLVKCNMQEVGKIKQGYWPIAELNLLYSQNIINIDQTQRKNTDKSIDGKTVLETLFKLNGKIQCTFNNDYDCDGLDNTKDNCPNTYNPKQNDTDKDKIGDVCDDDIDGDKIKNPTGIIDDEGKIDINKRTKDTDNCLFIINDNQQDTNQNSIGDICENKDENIGIYINIDKLEGNAPLTATFTAITQGQTNNILRDFGDQETATGGSVSHTFITPGIYNIQARAEGINTTAVAEVIVIVGGPKGDNKALQTRASDIGGTHHVQSTLSAGLIGDFDEIEWIFPGENISFKKSPNQTVTKIFTQTGENTIIVKGYSKSTLMGISTFTLGVATGRGAILKSNTPNPNKDETVLFDTKTYNINQSDIISSDWDFGDNTYQNTTTLTIEHTYTKSGKKIVTQTITLNDGKKLINMLTLNVVDKDELGSYALLMIPSKLIATIGEKITFTVRIIGTLLKTPIIQIANFADGTIQKKAGTESMPSTFTHSFAKNGLLAPESNLYIDQCTTIKNQTTIAIKGIDSCLDSKIQGNLKAKYKCDLDGDGIPDICDTDIDNDGLPNLLGIIAFENKDCSYNNNFNKTILTKHYKGICSLDNAPTNYNPDQLDLDLNGIGDAQKDINGIEKENIEETIDTDNDSIPDIQDLCPTLQETRNNIQDEDGCPETNQEILCNLANIPNNLKIQADCNQCPCPLGDYTSDLTNGDQVRAILRDKQKTIQYKFSLPRIVDI